MSLPRAVVCLLHFPKGRTLTLTLNLFLSYAILISLFAPFMLRKVEAASHSATKPRVPTAAEALRKESKWRDGELLVRFRQEVTEQQKNELTTSKAARRMKKLRGKARLEKLRLARGAGCPGCGGRTAP